MSDGVTEWRQEEVLAEMAGRVASGMDRAASFAAEQARGMVPRASGLTASEIDYEVKAHGLEVTGRVGVKRSRSWLARIIEVGAVGHKITPSHRKVLAKPGTVFGKLVKHPGTKARPFLRPAVFSHLSEIIRLICEG